MGLFTDYRFIEKLKLFNFNYLTRQKIYVDVNLRLSHKLVFKL